MKHSSTKHLQHALDKPICSGSGGLGCSHDEVFVTVKVGQ